ncbi:Aste57867_14603 [Aphanomyces stellatus]|uniref:Aste57867_14603 protein n=1 Tax=Aphanomyces stellatus TaxID=120398 RepID=A0A485L138_9STRA|nr:hypothetical protein As57867_014549 [Aphanomyces stellatus]VFT91422.1 Aste57867_14603 [Aphanomyces stellatus]
MPQLPGFGVMGSPSSPFIGATRPDKRLQLQLVTIGALLVFFLGIAIPFMLTQAKTENRVHGFEVIYSQPRKSRNLDSILPLTTVIAAVSTDNYEISISTTLGTLPGSLASAHSLLKAFRVQAGPGVMVVTPKTTNIKLPLISKIPLIKGSAAWYPFDKYTTKVVFEAFVGTSPFMGHQAEPIELAINMTTAENFNWRYKVRKTMPEDFNDDIVVGAPGSPLTIEVSRKFNVYAALVFVCVWSVTVAVGYIGSCAVIWKHRPPDNPIIFVSALFAVPTIRNMLPGSPPFGALISDSRNDI